MVNAIPFPEWSADKADSTKICDLHFDAEDFKQERTDSNTSRKYSKGKLNRTVLEEFAIPHIWPGYPDYLSKVSPKRRSDTATADVRCEKENALN